MSEQFARNSFFRNSRMAVKKKTGGKKNSLVGNINARKKKGISRSRRKSTVSAKAYNDMKSHWKK
jgi:hypothetical protein